MTDRYQDLLDTPLSVGGVERDRAAVRIHVGMVYAGRTVTVESADHAFRIYDDGQLLTEVARTTTKTIARFKVREPEPSRQRRHRDTVPTGKRIDG